MSLNPENHGLRLIGKPITGWELSFAEKYPFIAFRANGEFAYWMWAPEGVMHYIAEVLK